MPDLPPGDLNDIVTSQLKGQQQNPSAFSQMWPYLLGPAAGGLAAKGAAALKAVVPIASALRTPRISNRIYSDTIGNFSGNKKYDFIRQALENSKARISPEGVQIGVRRSQDPSQVGKDALSGGVFYTPSAAAVNSPYRKGLFSRYGGPQIIGGTTLLRNPLFTHGDAGWLEDASDTLLGSKNRHNIQNEIYDIADHRLDNNLPEALKSVGSFRQKWSPETASIPPELFLGEKGSYSHWLNQAAIAHRAREMGYDSIVPMSYGESGNPRIDEIFDLRENKYPGPSGEYSLWPQFNPKGE